MQLKIPTKCTHVLSSVSSGRSEDLLSDVADDFASIEAPAERVRLAFKLFDSESVALVDLPRDGSDVLEQMRQRAARPAHFLMRRAECA